MSPVRLATNRFGKEMPGPLRFDLGHFFGTYLGLVLEFLDNRVSRQFVVFIKYSMYQMIVISKCACTCDTSFFSRNDKSFAA